MTRLQHPRRPSWIYAGRFAAGRELQFGEGNLYLFIYLFMTDAMHTAGRVHT